MRLDADGIGRIRAGDERCSTAQKSGGTNRTFHPGGSARGVISAVR